MNGDITGGDPRILVAMTLIGLGITTAEKLHKLWSQPGEDNAGLKADIEEAKRRLRARGIATE